jgi:octaprenyl-diphosphate synthase
MTLQLETAVSVLERGAQAKKADPRLEKRLSDVQSFLAEDLFAVERALSEAVSDGVEPGVSAARHLVAQGGKRVRPVSVLLAGRCFGKSGRAFVEMGAVVELIHSATLLHDDVVDEGLERRGVPTSRRLYGNGVSVLSGDLLLVNALERTQTHAPELLSDLISTLRRLVDGEIIQLRGRTELDLSEATYYRILSDKTASLFSLATRAGAVLAGASEEQCRALSQFGEALGIAFQLVDDVIDYAGHETGKAMFADLVEGKLTLPLVLAIERDPGLADLVRKIHDGDASPVAEVSRRVIASGACDEVRRRAKAYADQAQAALSVLPNVPARALLEVVALEMTKRLA